MNITNPKNIKDIQSKIKVITIELEFKLINSHSMNHACPLFRQSKEYTRQLKEPLNKNTILDKYIETIHNTV